jgi:alcohol dehydrogenase class IV
MGVSLGGWRKTRDFTNLAIAKAKMGCKIRVLMMNRANEILRSHQVALPLCAEIFAEVPPEPPIDVVDTIAARIKASGAEAVIALGGGSVMDAAKVALLCVRHGKEAREFVGIGKAVCESGMT